MTLHHAKHSDSLKRRASAGFTVTELLLAASVIAVLLALAFPQLSRMIELSRAANCVSRMQQVSMLLHGFLAENNGKIKLFRDGSDGGDKRWYNQLKNYGNLSPDAAQKAFGCASLSTTDVNDWFCFGFRTGGSPGIIMRDYDGAPRLYNLNFRNVEEPSRFWILADTITPGSGKQTFRIIPPGTFADGGIHLRHQKRANTLFADGHVESLDAAALAALGITEVINERQEKTSTALSRP
jgi:prepilin-type processing-associated H-X9-DG protein